MALNAFAGWSAPPIAAMPALSAEATSWSLMAGVFGLVVGVLVGRRCSMPAKAVRLHSGAGW